MGKNIFIMHVYNSGEVVLDTSACHGIIVQGSISIFPKHQRPK